MFLAGRSMAGRREQQKRDRERRILCAAAHLFGTKGYAETAMEDVAVRARLAVGTLYNYFRSKSELLLAILRRETEQLLAAGQPQVDDPSEDPTDAIAGVIDAYLDVFAHHDRKLWRDLFAAAIAEPSAIGAAAFRADLRLIGQLTSLLEKLRERGGLGAHVEPGRAAITLYSVYIVWFAVFLVDEGVTIERLREEVRRGIEIGVCGLLPISAQERSPDARVSETQQGGAR
ncbi:MAG: TetR/AcrR family transcriptional regulator [Myxococcota bacterium]